MDKEQYVTYKIARLLKKKGFDWEVNGYFCSDVDNLSRIEWSTKDYNSHKFHVSAPTQQMACDWLREEKNIYVIAVPDIGNSLRFYPAIYVIKGEIPEEYWFEYINSVVEELHKSYDKPQQAVKAALQYVLTNLI